MIVKPRYLTEVLWEMVCPDRIRLVFGVRLLTDEEELVFRVVRGEIMTRNPLQNGFCVRLQEFDILAGVERLVQKDIIGIQYDLTAGRERYVADGIHENDKQKWPKN